MGCGEGLFIQNIKNSNKPLNCKNYNFIHTSKSPWPMSLC